MKYLDAVALKGKLIVSITGKPGDDEVILECLDGSQYRMFHDQDCCESVSLFSITGDCTGFPLTTARERVSKDPPSDLSKEDIIALVLNESYTWTTYTLGHKRGTCVIRWLGTSNGYYSEHVQIDQIREARK